MPGLRLPKVSSLLADTISSAVHACSQLLVACGFSLYCTKIGLVRPVDACRKVREVEAVREAMTHDVAHCKASGEREQKNE